MDEIEKKEEWYLNIDYREAKEIIRNKLQGMTQNFIGIGFYLRQIKETEGFRKDGYESIYEIAEDQYGIKRSTAIRWMQMNEKFSQGGYSPFLDSGYKDFGKSQLQEMLYLDSEQLEEVTPEMTVREIRRFRKKMNRSLRNSRKVLQLLMLHQSQSCTKKYLRKPISILQGKRI